MLSSFSSKKGEKDGPSFAGTSLSRVGLNGERAGISIIGADLVIVGSLVSNG